MNRLFADVVLDGAVGSYDKPYSYLVPEEYQATAQPGIRVTVPFGRGNIKKQGMILSLKSDGNFDKCKEIISFTDKKPILNDEMIKLCVWMHERLFCTYYDAIHTLLPAGLSYRMAEFCRFNPEFDISLLNDESEITVLRFIKENGEIAVTKLENRFENVETVLKSLEKAGAVFKTSEPVRRMGDLKSRWVRITDPDFSPQNLTERQREIYDLIEQTGEVSIKELKYFTGVTDSVINKLINSGVITVFEKEEFRTPETVKYKAKREEIVLTPSQNAAYEGLKNKMFGKDPDVSLLYGVTGSGKTQVFLKLADDMSDAGRGVIIMVPEIALTPQMIELFGKRYGEKIAIFHSAMSIGRRMDEYKRIEQGKALIAIGTRSAVFAPFKDLGLIVIDEEQEHTYKSEKSPRYNAKDIAKFRIKYHNALLCLASATPSLESYSAAINGKYGLYKLSERYGAANLPKVTVVDMRKEILSGNSMSISSTLAQAIQNELEKKKQIVLLLNRRGRNTYVSCPKCGWVASCPNCSISLTYHSANGRMMCHYCGYSENSPKKCPECSSEHITFYGAGTQKLEEELKILFPSAFVLRLDADSTLSRDSYSVKLTDFANGKYDILLGTQMVAKGLDFPNVSLVGVVGADRALYSDDYRSFERTFSLLTQVIGRAGRAGGEATAVIQTVDPSSSVISLAKTQDFEAFYNEEIMTRKLMTYPPFCDICMVAATSTDRGLAQKAITDIFNLLKSAVEGDYSDIKLMILGPAAAAVLKVNNRYRYRMIIKCRNSKRLRELLRKCIKETYSKDTTVFVDFNPENVL